MAHRRLRKILQLEIFNFLCWINFFHVAKTTWLYFFKIFSILIWFYLKTTWILSSNKTLYKINNFQSYQQITTQKMSSLRRDKEELDFNKFSIFIVWTTQKGCFLASKNSSTIIIFRHISPSSSLSLSLFELLTFNITEMRNAKTCGNVFMKMWLMWGECKNRIIELYINSFRYRIWPRRNKTCPV